MINFKKTNKPFDISESQKSICIVSKNHQKMSHISHSNFQYVQ